MGEKWRIRKCGYSNKLSDYWSGKRIQSNWLEALRSDNFKVSLSKVFVDIWENHSTGKILRGKKLYVIKKSHVFCFKYAIKNGLNFDGRRS